VLIGYRLIALAIVLLAGAVLVATGNNDLQVLGSMLMLPSGILLLIDLVLSYIIKK
jgi:hypothetical protein